MKKSFLLSISLILFVGCASSIQRGVVAMKISDQEAHVGIGADELAVGDHVELYHNECQSYPLGEKGRSARSCKKVPYGHGEVIELLNKDYSVVKFPAGTKFSEGDTIEKHGH